MRSERTRIARLGFDPGHISSRLGIFKFVKSQEARIFVVLALDNDL